MPSVHSPSVHVASRVHRFTYAIRNIVAEAEESKPPAGRVRYLNIGDPIPFGFSTPPHLVEAVARAMRDGHNGYVPSAGITPAREAVAADWTRQRHSRSTPDRVLITAGTSEGIELALTAIVERRRRGARANADVSALHRRAREDRRATRATTGPTRRAAGMPDLDHVEALDHHAHARARGHRSEQSDRCGVFRRRRGAR